MPYSWISNLRPTKRNIKNLKENNEILNLVQKEYINAGNSNNIYEKNNNDEISGKNIKNIIHLFNIFLMSINKSYI